MHPLTRRLASVVNRTDGVNAVPFAAPVAMTPRVGERWASWAHYGVMAPGLPEPHRWFGVMAILGTSGARCFDDDARIVTTPRDTAYVVAGTAVDGAATSYSMARDCALAPDGSSLRFGAADLELAGAVPRVRVRRGEVALDLEVTDKVAYFSRIPGVYDHWSLLASYTGTVSGERVAGLCTYEYARGAGPYTVARKPVPRWARAPIASFTYQVLNLPGDAQLLLTAAGPARGRYVHEGAWERALDWHGGMHRDVDYVVLRDGAELTTPDGRAMTLPAEWTWTVRDRGVTLAALRCVAREDWVYGLGSGYVGSFAYAGTYRGRPVDGSAYVEAIEV